MKIIIGAILVTIINTVSAFAETKHEVLYAQNELMVSEMVNPNEFYACSISSLSDTSLYITVYAQRPNAISIAIFNEYWNLVKRPISFHIVFDDGISGYVFDGEGHQNGVVSRYEFNNDVLEFLGHFALYSKVTILTSDNKKLDEFSLAGSSAAIKEFFECRERINNYDPFDTPNSDPFHE